MGRLSTILFDHRPADLAGALARLGAGVDRVIMTHAHFDHASGLPQFPDAELVIDAREWRVATRPSSGLWPGGYCRDVLLSHTPARLIDHAREGRREGPFESVVDLFGDGSVRLVSTPGHTIGHQSVLLRLGEGELLLTADAAVLESLLDTPRPMAAMQNRSAFIDSLRRLRAWRSNGGRLIPGHDRNVWARLDELYA